MDTMDRMDIMYGFRSSRINGDLQPYRRAILELTEFLLQAGMTGEFTGVMLMPEKLVTGSGADFALAVTSDEGNFVYVPEQSQAVHHPETPKLEWGAYPLENQSIEEFAATYGRRVAMTQSIVGNEDPTYFLFPPSSKQKPDKSWGITDVFGAATPTYHVSALAVHGPASILYS